MVRNPLKTLPSERWNKAAVTGPLLKGALETIFKLALGNRSMIPDEFWPTTARHNRDIIVPSGWRELQLATSLCRTKAKVIVKHLSENALPSCSSKEFQPGLDVYRGPFIF